MHCQSLKGLIVNVSTAVAHLNVIPENGVKPIDRSVMVETGRVRGLKHLFLDGFKKWRMCEQQQLGSTYHTVCG
jgi:hypothetical protein